MITSITYIQDPLFHYRDPFGDRPFEEAPYYTFKNPTYQIPGLVKNREYDAVISGSSLTQNFDTAYFDEFFGGKTLKLSLSGANTRNSSTMVSLSLRSQSKLKRAFILLDIPAYYFDIDEEGNQPPEYLLNDIFFDDVDYLLNKDILLNYILYNAEMRRQSQLRNAPENEQGMWYGFSYGISKVLSQYSRPDAQSAALPVESYVVSVDSLLSRYWIPLIEQYPDVTFIFFTPPYSILYWDESVRLGTWSAYLEGYRKAISRLCAYDNVEVYFFTDSRKVITNPWNYKDSIHYHLRVNDWMTECMAQGRHQVSLLTLDRRIDMFKQWLMDYDVEWIFDHAFMDITTPDAYLSLLNEKGYSFLCTIGAKNAHLMPEYLQQIVADAGETVQGEGWLCFLCQTGGTQIVRMIQPTQPALHLKLDNSNVALRQMQFGDVPLFSISIDGVEYSQNSCGLNFVVYDTINKRVIDSVAFEGDDLSFIQRDSIWSDLPWYRESLRQTN